MYSSKNANVSFVKQQAYLEIIRSLYASCFLGGLSYSSRLAFICYFLHDNFIDKIINNFRASYNKIRILTSSITIANTFNSFDEHHQKGFNLLKDLLHKSYQKNAAFRNMSANQELQYKFDIIMDF